MQKPLILNDTDKYNLEVSDFPNQLDKFIFSAIYNLYVGGAECIHTVDVDTALKSNPRAKELIEKENGIQFLQDCEAIAETQNFQYYYSKLKKLNLIKDLQKAGNDTNKIYCEDILDENYLKINEAFEKMAATDIINSFKLDISNLEKKYCFNQEIEECAAVDGIEELLEELKEKPDIGVKLQGDFFNTIVRGGRKGTLYLRSAPSSFGKSRLMVGDACYIAYPLRYEPQYKRWVSTGHCEKVLYIMTEQDPKEIQTMILAWLTGLNEEIFKYGQNLDRPDIKEIVDKALEIMKTYKDNLLFVRVPDPCSSVIKNIFRRYNIQYGVENFFFDYIFSTPAMLAEYRDLKLREDVCLRLFTTTLKNLALELNAFVMSATQIYEQENDKKSSWKDYHNIAGARAIVHLIDVGCIVSRPTKEELKLIESLTNAIGKVPNFVVDFYKNRGGRWTMLRLWAIHDLGTCRRQDLFITTPDMRPIDEDFTIIDFTEEVIDDQAKEIESRFNQGIVVDDSINEMVEDFLGARSDIVQHINDEAEAFGGFEGHKKRIKEKSWDDLL